MKSKAGILIAATSSGAGKTITTLGLMQAMKSCRRIVPFKVGPDYIDAAYHRWVLNRPSYNLDFHTLGEERLRALYLEKTQAGDLAVVEGVMGLYDGADSKGFGSSAHLAKVLGLPTLLVLDAGGMSTSAAAVVLGFKEFDHDLNLSGVILNKVGSPMHYELLKSAIEDGTGIPVLGYLPKDLDFVLPEGQLGLVPAKELPDLREKIQRLGEVVKRHVDIPRVLEISQEAKPISSKVLRSPKKVPKAKVKIALARDKAFNFYYSGALELMEDLGIEFIPYSPVEDEKLPEDISGLYIGGGFPESFAIALSDNLSMLASVKKAIEKGLPTYAEGGGFMYLSKGIQKKDGYYPMVGIYDMVTEMTGRLQRFGYVIAEVKQNNILAKPRQILYGHEFHYSKMVGYGENPTFMVKKGQREWPCGYAYKNCLATFLHLDFYRDPGLLIQFIESAQKYNRGVI